MSDSLLDIELTTLDGRATSLRQLPAKLWLIVNTASQCGFTPQYAGLQALSQEFQERGLLVLGFPCNQFGAQEPGDAAQIGAFCEKNYGVSFPLFAKVEVNGAHAHPLFVALKKGAPGLLGSEGIKWNFTKFLVAADGQVIERFAPATAPEQLRERIAALL